MPMLFAPQPPCLVGPPARRCTCPAIATALPARRPEEVYRRRRLIAIAMACGLMLAIVSFGRQADAALSKDHRPDGEVTVIVQPGDTLWGIARSLSPDADPRPLVDELSALAGSAIIQPGQELVIPGRLLD